MRASSKKKKIKKFNVFFGMISKVGVPTLARGSARLPPSQRSGSVSLSLSLSLSLLFTASFLCLLSVRPSLLYLSVCHPSLPTCIQDAAAALSDHLAGTQLRNCASRQMPCRTVGDGGGGVMQSPSVSSCAPPLPPSFTWPPHGPHPSTPLPPAPSTLPLSPPPSVIPGLSISARGTVGKAVCVGSSQQLPSITAHCSVAS